jgi:hypothetical protein
LLSLPHGHLLSSKGKLTSQILKVPICTKANQNQLITANILKLDVIFLQIESLTLTYKTGRGGLFRSLNLVRFLPEKAFLNTEKVTLSQLTEAC